MDVLEVRKAMLDAVNAAREGAGPSLLECRTYRYKGHGIYDPGLAYRTKEEISEWMLRDPINRIGKLMIEQGMITPVGIQSIDREVAKEIEDSVEFAKSSPYPTLEEMNRYTYVGFDRNG